VNADSYHAADKLVATTTNKPEGVNRVVADRYDIKSNGVNKDRQEEMHTDGVSVTKSPTGCGFSPISVTYSELTP
jgi:hypothetical protein